MPPLKGKLTKLKALGDMIAVKLESGVDDENDRKDLKDRESDVKDKTVELEKYLTDVNRLCIGIQQLKDSMDVLFA